MVHKGQGSSTNPIVTKPTPKLEQSKFFSQMKSNNIFDQIVVDSLKNQTLQQPIIPNDLQVKIMSRKL